MKNERINRHPHQVWVITTLIFPALYILYRLTDWKKEQYSVLGVFYLFLMAVIIGGLLSLPSLVLSSFACRHFTRKLSTGRSHYFLTAVFSIAAMFITLTVLNLFLYPLQKNYWIIGMLYSVCVLITSSISGRAEEMKKGIHVPNKPEKTSWRFSFPYRLRATKAVIDHL